jgi:hypothetical protein
MLLRDVPDTALASFGSLATTQTDQPELAEQSEQAELTGHARPPGEAKLLEQQEPSVLTHERAASKLQSIWRAGRSRQALVKMVLQAHTVTRARDGAGITYYYNSSSGVSSYVKPVFLRNVDDAMLASYGKLKAPAERKVFRSDDEAALYVQKVWRASRARWALRKALLSAVRRVVDADGTVYYAWHSGETSYTKPLLLRGWTDKVLEWGA